MEIKKYDMRIIENTTTARTERVQSGPRVRAEVVLGSPSASCSGVGICRVMAHGKKDAIKCPKVNTLLSVTSEGKLRFEFEKASMEGRYMRRHFRWMLFQVFEAYLVPFSALGSLKLKQRTIKPGIYQVWESEDWLKVEF